MSFSQSLVKSKENEENRAKSTPIGMFTVVEFINCNMECKSVILFIVYFYFCLAMVAPELKQNTDADTEITKTCAVLGCEESKNLGSELYFR